MRVPLAIAAVCLLGSAQAPPTPVDAGTLTSTFNSPMGVRTSSEEFTIVRNADGGFTMTNISTEGRQMRSVLTTDAKGNPIAYEHHGKGGEAAEKTITSKRLESGLLVISEMSSRNPPAAPFSFPPDTLLFGDGAGAQLWFLGLGPVPRDVSYFPAGVWTIGVQKARLTETGRESVTIDGSPIEATHYVLQGGIMSREFWLDAQKRLVKISSRSGVTVRTKRP